MPYEVSMGAGLAHRLELDGRERLTVSGVADVGRFDESTIVMATCAGTMVISGEGLHIGKLSLDGGMTCPNRDGTCGRRADRRGEL